MMTYAEVLDHLEALQMHKIKLGLDAMQAFLSKVGRPEEKIKFVHLAGTNGKGTVCAVLAEILGRAGYKVGVYTSPHLSSVRERFRIGGDYISEDSFARLGTRICQTLGEDQITYFEFTTALGLLWFAESDVDLVLLETGMGGRLDATNVVTPLVSVITSISMDHEIYLGNTLHEIAGEKAGIIKEGVPVVSAAIDPEAIPVINATCRERNAPLYLLRRDFDFDYGEEGTNWSYRGKGLPGGKDYEELCSNSPSLVTQENEAVALTVIQLLAGFGFSVDPSNIYDAVASVVWPGRMEYLEQSFQQEETADGSTGSSKELQYLLDGAHNPAGVKNLSETLKCRFTAGRRIGIWGAMIDKDLAGILQTITPQFDKLILTQPDGERSATAEQIYKLLSDKDKNMTICTATPEEALITAQQEAEEGDLIVIGGSLYLIGAIRYLLKGDLV